MKRLVTCILLMAFSAGFAFAHSPGTEIRHDLNGIKIEAVEGRVHIQATNRPLREILQVIESLSEIHFRFSEDALGEPVTVNLHSATWTAAINQLLEGFSRIDFQDDQGALTQVLFLGTAGGQEPTRSKPSPFSAAGSASRGPSPLTGTLSDNLHTRIAGIPNGRELPVDIAEAPELVDLFQQHGIASPDEWMLIKRRNTIRAVRKRDGTIQKKRIQF